MEVLCKKLENSFFEEVVPLYLSGSNDENSNCSTSSPILDMVNIFNLDIEISMQWYLLWL